jgi:hypothetical protein
MTTTATRTKTTVCKSVSFFGEKCRLRKPHTKRHTWDSEAYRRKRKAAIEAAETPSKKTTPGGKDVGTVKGRGDKMRKVVKGAATSEVIDVMISFDTTGSMGPCIGEVRKNTVALVESLFKDIPDLRIGIIAHGDYADKNETYVTKMLDLTRDSKKITNFVKTCGNTCGFDSDECYELVLHEARKLVSWETGRNKVLVMIGDANPHAPSYHLNTKRLDWKEECRKLAGNGVSIYTVQCLYHASAEPFWKGMADITGGHHLVLDKFENIRDLIKAVCYKQQSPEALENFVRCVESGGRMTGGMAKVYSSLLGYEISSKGAEADGAKRIDPSRFIVFKVTKDSPIRDFVKLKRKDFRVGCGYYQFTKSVKIQDHKEIILLEEETGDLFGGKESRRILGLPENGTIDVAPKKCAALQDGRYTAFVRSTSVNRKLIGGTKFLYENEHFGR